MKNVNRRGSITVTCKVCPTKFKSPPSRIRTGHSQYCSKKCWKSDISRVRTGRKMPQRFGESNPNWRGIRVARPCPICGSIFSTQNKTCSAKCGQASRNPLITGDNNSWRKLNPPELKKCAQCGKPYSRDTGNLGDYFCSNECAARRGKRSMRQTLIQDRLKAAGLVIQPEKSWPWLHRPGIKQRMSIDIYIPQYNVAVEYDGEHHRNPRAFAAGRDKFETIQERDRCKNYLLIQNGIRLIRLSDWPVDMEKLIKDITSF